MMAILHIETARRPWAAAVWIAAAVCFASSAMAQTPSGRVRVAYPDTWGAVDGLGRILPDYRDVGGIKKNKTVGIFYFLTRVHAGHVILNNDLVLQKHPNAIIGPMYSTHWWAEPLFGYYRSSDPYVLRVHAEMLADAGVNTVIFDNTNGPIYLSVQKALFETWLRLRKLGDKTPQFACFAGNGAWNKVYHSIYKPGLAKKLWFHWDGKPLLLYHGRKSQFTSAERRFFTLRYCWGLTGGKNQWGWDNLGANPNLYGWHKNPHTPEEMPVAVGGWASSNIGRSYHDGREPPPKDQRPWPGICFARQWAHVLSVNPPFVFITGWNEWTAGAWPAPGPLNFAGRMVNKGDPIFIDEYSPEFSRDAEPMLADRGGLYGGFGDNYYYQMVAEIRRYKGVHRLPPIHRAVIHIAAPMAQWNHIGPLFINNIGLAVHRDDTGWGPEHYVNNTGRNDIVACKCAYSKKYIYFWVKTRAPITPWRGRSWMLLYPSIPTGGSNWMGYNYVIDRHIVNGHTTTVQRNIGGYHWRTMGQARFRVHGRQMQLAIPRRLLGIPNAMPAEFHFKWADYIAQNGRWTDFYLNGDCAPPFRFYYRAKISR
ncbi:MAG: hypothetical protein ACP5O1_10725 [Phycisphaerae bacterium]